MNKMIDDHWRYVQGVLLAHGTTIKEIELCEFHYKSAFQHGFKHAQEEISCPPSQFAHDLDAITSELQRAIGKHPHFPNDIIHAVAIMCEESGEAIQAALQFKYEGGKKEDVRKELIHTGAMVLRCLINLDGMN